MQESHHASSELLQSLAWAKGDERSAVRYRLREGEDAEVILSRLGQRAPQTRSAPDPHRRLRVALAQSSSTLQEILSVRLVANSQVVPAKFDNFRNRVIDAETIRRTIESDEVSPRVDAGTGQSDITLDSPIHDVPAEPWTLVTSNNLFISRLISVFLSYINPYWRYVEDDLFLSNMQSAKPGPFCSSFLVNAICALACVSEI